MRIDNDRDRVSEIVINSVASWESRAEGGSHYRWWFSLTHGSSSPGPYCRYRIAPFTNKNNNLSSIIVMARGVNNRPGSTYHQAQQPQQIRRQSSLKPRDADSCCSVKFVKNVLHVFNIIFFVSKRFVVRNAILDELNVERVLIVKFNGIMLWRLASSSCVRIARSVMIQRSEEWSMISDRSWFKGGWDTWSGFWQKYIWFGNRNCSENKGIKSGEAGSPRKL